MIKFQKIVQLLVTALVWFVVITVVHELGHSLYAQVVHGCGNVEIEMDGFWAGETFICAAAAADQYSWMAGGLFAALISFILWGLARWSPTKWDLDDEFVLAVFGTFQFAYGITEPTLKWQPEQAPVIIPLVCTALTFPVILYYSYKWAIWYKEG